jgi:bile acid:Na+ symporter, BASS family
MARRDGGERAMEGLLQALTEQVTFLNSEVVPWVLRLVMLGLGLSLTLADFRRVFVYPKAATIGLVAQLVGLPLTAFALTLLFGPAPAIAVGLVILAACPSGVTANAYTFAARADVPLCVTLSAVTSIITVFTIPFLTYLALQMFYETGQMPELPVLGMLRQLILLTLVPVAIGMLVRWRWPAFAERAVEPIRKAVLWLLIIVLVLAALSSIDVIRDNIASAGALVVTMNVLTMALGYGLARMFKLPVAQVVTITFEVGVQNLALALAITLRILQAPELAVAALLYAVVMPATALAFVSIARRMMSGEEKTAVEALGPAPR